MASFMRLYSAIMRLTSSSAPPAMRVVVAAGEPTWSLACSGMGRNAAAPAADATAATPPPDGVRACEATRAETPTLEDGMGGEEGGGGSGATVAVSSSASAPVLACLMRSFSLFMPRLARPLRFAFLPGTADAPAAVTAATEAGAALAAPAAPLPMTFAMSSAAGWWVAAAGTGGDATGPLDAGVEEVEAKRAERVIEGDDDDGKE